MDLDVHIFANSRIQEYAHLPEAESPRGNKTDRLMKRLTGYADGGTLRRISDCQNAFN